jgi:hypothetical protein
VEESVPQITILIDGPLPSATTDDLSAEAVEPFLQEAPAAPAIDESIAIAENAAADPRMADFLPVAILPAVVLGSCRAAAPEVFPACRAIAIPAGEVIWNVSFATEERPAELIDSVPFDSAAAFAPTNIPLSAQSLAHLEMGFEAVSPETAGPAGADENNTASGYNSPWIYAEPMDLSPASLAVPVLNAVAGNCALAPIEEHAEIPLLCHQIDSAPALACEIALAHETHLPVFAPPREFMHVYGDPESAADPTAVYWGELYSEPAQGSASASLPEPEIAPALALHSTPVDRPALLPACSTEMMQPNFKIASSRQAAEAPAQFGMPELSSMIESQPGPADISQGEGVKSVAGPRSHEPLKPSFGSSVRIKNWRLRITFAKPA